MLQYAWLCSYIRWTREIYEELQVSMHKLVHEYRMNYIALALIVTLKTPQNGIDDSSLPAPLV